ncbi:MAG TPA: tetraacyldisaccharide 4'-kinase [Candidatus Hydrogenedentes bacterium]|nr:tetraacyldisaccharide 4'-kinase [Candidatus Hydrogenedentota bacterium]HIJ74822.1 tetraacyldisaccharide 4'-kinase [Candidatus Hydrogenedentota bacterium]
MKILDNLAEKVRRGEPVSLPASVLLSAGTPFVRLGMWRRLRRPRVRVGARVISFGNITAGGTGKTPAVIERARRELDAGHRVAVLTRGYGAPDPARLTVAQAEILSPDTVGDEPALIARKLPRVLIIKGADRVAAANKAVGEYGCDTLILDDGFQYVRLERDENVAVVDATNPFGNGRLIPRGILREPPTALARATHVILTRCDQAEDLDSVVSEVAKLCPDIPIRKTYHCPSSLWRVADGAELGLDAIRGKEVAAFCAIGNPESFFATLEAAGAVVAHRLAFPDHGVIPQERLEVTPGTIVVTEKDAVRFEDPPANVLALGIELKDFGAGSAVPNTS